MCRVPGGMANISPKEIQQDKIKSIYLLNNEITALSVSKTKPGIFIAIFRSIRWNALVSH